MADDVVTFTQELVRIRSTADAGEAAAARAVEAKMRSFGWDPIIEEVAPGRPNVIAVLEGGAGPGPTLLLEGHTDVVTEGDPDSWTVPPYDGLIRDGRLYGRGAADMKAGLATIVYAARAVQLDGPFPGRLIVAALVDEEGMMAGARAFACTPLARGIDAAIIAEPEGGEICAVAKGALRLRIEVHGLMAHGAMPEHGRNPVPAAARILTELASYQLRLLERFGTHEQLGSVYVTPTFLNAGSLEQLNVIPARCTIGLDVRTTPDVDHGTIINEIREVVSTATAADLTVEIAVVDDRPAVDTALDDPIVVSLARAHELVTGQPARFGGVPGATDGTILTKELGIPTVVYGPGGKWIAHQADEYVEPSDIMTYAEVFRSAARSFLES